MIVGIIGSRRRATPQDYMLLKRKVRRIILGRDRRVHLRDRIEKIVTGDCEEGGDHFAELIQREEKIKEIDVKYKKNPLTGERWEREYDEEGKPIWITKKEFTNMCYARNEEVAKEPLDLLFALVARDRTGGTEHTIEMFKKHHYDWEEKLILV